MLRAWRVWLVQVAETDCLTCVPPLGIRLTCLPRVVQPLPPHLARHDFNPFWGSFTWFLGGYPLVFSLASWREKKLMVASLAWLGLDEKGAWVPPGYNKCYLIRNCSPFHMLFLTCEPSHAILTCKSSDIVWLSLSETVCDPFKFSQHMKGPMIRHVSLYLKLKGEILYQGVKHPANQNKQFSVCWCNNERDKMPAYTTTWQDADTVPLNWCNMICIFESDSGMGLFLAKVLQIELLSKIKALPDARWSGFVVSVAFSPNCLMYQLQSMLFQLL